MEMRTIMGLVLLFMKLLIGLVRTTASLFQYLPSVVFLYEKGIHLEAGYP
jgi:hypothetical protein